MKPDLLRYLNSGDDGEDRRFIERQQRMDDGRLVLTHSSALDCVIMDFHGGGARIALRTAIDVPWEDLTLELLTRGLTFPASKVWQSNHEIGLRFTGNAVTAI